MLQYTKENTKGKEMKYIQNITTLLLAMTLALLLSACNTKTSQDENNTAGSSSPTTQTTEDTSATGSSGSSNAADGSNNTTSGTDDNTTTGGGDDNTTTTPTVTLKSLNLTVGKTTLNKEENTTVKVMATYSDNSSKEVTDKVEWVVVPSDAVKMTNATLAALQDKATTLKAKLKGKTSNAIDLNITWVVNGHTLPPEPDPQVNNATLLGVDVNDNGVRDDVERWIYETYDEYVPCHQELDYNDVEMIDGEAVPNAIQVCEEHPIPYHPIVKAVAMQVARAAQIIIQEPEKAKINKTYEVLDAAQDCEISIKHLKKRIYRNKEYAVIKKASLKEGNGLIEKLFNTTQRARAYAKYNYYLSGGIYSVPTDEEGLIYCDDNVNQLLKELK